MKIISLGWGVQSFTLAAMVALGELEKVDAALHADTTHESILTYQFRGRWETWLEAHGVPVRVVTAPTRPDPTDIRGGIGIPAYVNFGVPGLNRQCTYEWKVAPIRRWLQLNRHKEPIEQWLGISWDESQRMKDSDVKYITHRWPLIEMRMTRRDCEAWLKKHDLEIPSKSACTFCPYHSAAEWREIKRTPMDWAEAVAVDQAIRKGRPPYDLFVHSSRKPLPEVDLRTPEEKGQLSLWDDECSGICGV